MKLTPVFCFLLFSYTVTAQLEGSIWYFGDEAGLDFRNGAPTALFDGKLDTNEGCSVMSDFEGNLCSTPMV